MTSPSLLSCCCLAVRLTVLFILFLLGSQNARSRADAFEPPPSSCVYKLPPAVADQRQFRAPSNSNEIWLIDSRVAGASEYAPQLNYYRYQPGLWQSSNESEFLAAQDATKATCFWVHGNRVTDGGAVDRGLEVYRLLNAGATRPFRFVIWSWPSTRVDGSLRDVQFKAQLSDIYAYPLARLLHLMDPHVELSLLGYSFGARLICGALHLEAQSRLDAHGIPIGMRPHRAPIRVVLLAAAMDNDSFQPDRRNDQALTHVGQMLITVNRYDPAMNWYSMLYGVPGPHAMGAIGAAGISTPRVLHMDVGALLGPQHDLSGYLRAADPATWLGLNPPHEVRRTWQDR